MRRNHNNKGVKNDNSKTTAANGFLPNSIKFISSCIKTVSSNVRSAGASVVAGSLSGDEVHKDQVLWACFDKLELNASSIKCVLLLGYSNGFQVLDVDDASDVKELVSKHDDPVTFLQMQPIPEESEGREGFRMSHPLLLVVASDEKRSSGAFQKDWDGSMEPQMGNSIYSPTAVRFYSLRTHNYVHVLRFRSTVYMIRCSSRIVAVGLATQIYCFDAVTLETTFSVLTSPVPQLGAQGLSGINIGYGPMAVGPRWLAYASNNPLLSNTGCLSPQSLSPSPGVSPSTSPGSGSLVARYAMESSRQLATGLINLGDMGYKTLSKYCHELLPDGSSSPVSSNSSRKVSRAAAHSNEMETAGMVVIKDFVSREVISQFRAHTSPISALCFDPSGTLLVTASINGNNLNVFRILPSCSQHGSGPRRFDWNSSHVHLYKLHRGMTSAVIQDISFSHYSQWVSIVSSKGTCHIFVLSPFGGETALHLQSSPHSGPAFIASRPVPWWSTSSFITSRSSPPAAPTPITLSVVDRIKNVNFGWLNSVSNAAASATGNVSVPSGVIAATFHSSVRHSMEPAIFNVSALEHLLVYTPSGYVIQYHLLPSFGGEHSESPLGNGTTPVVHMQEEELRVKAEPIQWWDVCRRTDWPEREECVGGITLGRHDTAGKVMDTSDYEDNDFEEKDLVKPHERSHWYLSNAEVQMRSGRLPVWQKSKIYFYVMGSQGEEETDINKEYIGGEIDIEKMPANEVEVRRKDILPFFDTSQRIKSGWVDNRVLRGDRFSGSPSNSDQMDDKYPQGTVLSHPNMLSPHGIRSDGDRSSRELVAVQSSQPIGAIRSYSATSVNSNDGLKGLTYALDQRSFSVVNVMMPSEVTSTIISSLDENYVTSSSSTPMDDPLSVRGTIARQAQSSDSVVTSEASNTGSNHSDSSMNIVDEGLVHEDMHDILDFGHDFQEEYCKASTHDDGRELTEATNVDNCDGSRDKEKAEEDGDSDDMLGGVFAFSEEG